MTPGTLVLDCEGLSRAILQTPELTAWLAAAEAEDLRVVVSVATLVEVSHPRLNRARYEWTLSRLNVEPVTREIARDAAQLLAAAGLHGHKHAIDAMVCATALGLPGPVTVLTSDVGDIAAISQNRLRIVKI
ncbi:putative nucleic acid-binding protein [Streptosporangium album]|uniref:Putative nucleic acid-binding protein n=1 Tax=Streptosporangium album TaxID=47479 RepID=A0A7W7RWH6_9ACTN|nr:PIN domain-containing protein [Streptosporangium album]MBB4939217.1 putative nucleic acid-binding protein [Streptosporangium album]